MDIKMSYRLWLMKQCGRDRERGELLDWYAKPLETICNEEKIPMDELEIKINALIAKYDVGGEKEFVGGTGEDRFRYRDSLKLFKRFLESQYKKYP